MSNDESSETSSNETAAPQREQPRVIPSEELFAGGRVVLIQHAGELYRLLVTRNDRLILQK
jgi:hemin uptake protein HemP